MNKLLLLALIAAPAFASAQTLQSASGSQAIAIAGGGGTGGGTSRVVTVPTAIAPSFYGANPCSNSASAGGAGMGFGFSFGGQWTERECRDQEWFRFLYMAGLPGVGNAYACASSDRVRAAFNAAGVPCSGSAPQAAPAQPPAPVAAPLRARPDWCLTASVAELRRTAVCN